MKKSEAQRTLILKTARELFAKKGYNATTTRQISRAAKTAEGLLYYYFPHGKQEILETIVQSGVSHRLSLFKAAEVKAEGQSLTQQIMGIFDALCDAFQSEASYQSFIITIRERSVLSETQAEWITQAIEMVGNHLSHLLATDQAYAGLPDQTRLNLASIIAAIFQKVFYDELLIRNLQTISPAARQTVAHELACLFQMMPRVSS
ncbi:TetR/AcrR family transcriptional regulator [uncultured Secundilactobacillus sp.]|uniref:TetR/AcrR family transcriptional regulator n=1 Tax=uncultured Secundilactobacillus sp. TaxID=2813935 RepID=UPI0025897207|nr:TetR/AcrR family transcriptional regulator [uncultured Secundilactobacillus sp.]